MNPGEAWQRVGQAEPRVAAGRRCRERSSAAPSPPRPPGRSRPVPLISEPPPCPACPELSRLRAGPPSPVTIVTGPATPGRLRASPAVPRSEPPSCPPGALCVRFHQRLHVLLWRSGSRPALILPGGLRAATMAGEEDRRKRFISATAANYFGLDPAGGAAALAAGLHSRAELSRFLDDGNEFLLVVRHSGAQLSASNKVP